MRRSAPKAAHLVALATLASCTGDLPPPPQLTVTSPQRALMQEGGQVMVEGTTGPTADGDVVSRVTVNGQVAQLRSDGSFVAYVDVPDGMTLIETVATSTIGGRATDARAVQSGARTPVGSELQSAVTARLSAAAFKALSDNAGPFVKQQNLPGIVMAQGPINVSQSGFTAAITINDLTIGDIKVDVHPTDAGLVFSAEIDNMSVKGHAHYDAVISGDTDVTSTADSITISGTLVVTPNGTSGFTTSIANPTVADQNLQVTATGFPDTILSLVKSRFGGSIRDAAKSAAEGAIQPLMNQALGALGNPQTLAILDQTLNLSTSPASVSFSSDGALVSMNLQAALVGSETSPGFIVTPNGTPTMNETSGIQVGLSDDLLNEMLAEVHALGLLNVHIGKDLGFVDSLDFQTQVPPMVSANNPDGTLRLVLGDMTAAIGDKGTNFATVAVNASVDLSIEPGKTKDQIALKFGDVHLFLNQADVPVDGSGNPFDLSGLLGPGIELQLKNLNEFLITVPTPSVIGVTLDSLAMRADSGYLMVSGDIH